MKSNLLKSERERLGLSQAKLSQLVDSSVKTIANWESGASSPNAKQLKQLYESGFDIMLIVTGQNVANNLSVEEKNFLSALSRASELIKQAALNVLLSEPIKAVENVIVVDNDDFCDNYAFKAIGTETKFYNSEGKQVNQVKEDVAPYVKKKRSIQP